MFDFINNLFSPVIAIWSAYPLLRLAGYVLFAAVMYWLIKRAIRKQNQLNSKETSPLKKTVKKPLTSPDVKKAAVKLSDAQSPAALTSAKPSPSTPSPVIQSPVIQKSEAKLEAPVLPTVFKTAVTINQPETQANAHTPTLSFSPSNDNALPQLEAGELGITDSSDMIFGSLTPLFASLLPESEERKKTTKKELQRAGYFEPHAWHNLAAVRYLGVIVPILLCLLLLLIVPPELEIVAIIGMVILPLVGWSIPRLLVRSQGKSRLAKIEEGFPDMLDMLNMCVSQGLPILPSLKRVSQELTDIYPALSEELRITTQQAELGSVEQALVNFRDRVDIPEVNSFTSLLTQTERMGTSVSSALTQYSDNMRGTLQQRADAKANTATFKLLFPTVLCLVPAVYLFLLGPAIVDLSEFFYGGGTEVLTENTNAVNRVLRESN